MGDSSIEIEAEHLAASTRRRFGRDFSDHPQDQLYFLKLLHLFRPRRAGCRRSRRQPGANAADKPSSNRCPGASAAPRPRFPYSLPSRPLTGSGRSRTSDGNRNQALRPPGGSRSNEKQRPQLDGCLSLPRQPRHMRRAIRGNLISLKPGVRAISTRTGRRSTNRTTYRANRNARWRNAATPMAVSR